MRCVKENLLMALVKDGKDDLFKTGHYNDVLCLGSGRNWAQL